MKKIILSVIMGFVAIGTAFAVPDVGDRKALCEKHSDKYVWVEKTRVCVPINPCESVNMDTKGAYCLRIPALPRESEKRDLIINRYAEKVLNAGVVRTTDLGDGYLALRTTDGGYFVAAYSSSPVYSGVDSPERCHMSLHYAFSAYGYYGAPNFVIKEYDTNDRIEGISYATVPADSTECEDIGDFASLLLGRILQKDPDDTDCTFMCPKM